MAARSSLFGFVRPAVHKRSVALRTATTRVVEMTVNGRTKTAPIRKKRWKEVALSPLLRLPPGRSRGVVHDHCFGSVHRCVLFRVRVGVVPIQVVAVRVLPEVPLRYSVGVHERNQLHGGAHEQGGRATDNNKNNNNNSKNTRARGHALYFMFCFRNLPADGQNKKSSPLSYCQTFDACCTIEVTLFWQNTFLAGLTP